MSGWEIGDLAVCVEAHWVDQDCHAYDGIGPNVGDICRVDEVLLDDCFAMLGFAEWPEECFKAAQFRKIRPDAHEGSIEDWRDVVEFFTKRVNA